MELEELFSKLSTQDGVDVASGKVTVRKKLKEVIAGIPVYDIETVNVVSGEDAVFDELWSFSDFSHYNSLDTARCPVCNNFADGIIYYEDHENNCVFDNFNCLNSYYNNIYGVGSWTTMFSNDDFEVWIKISKDEAEIYEEYRKTLEGYWRKLNVVCCCEEDSSDLESIFG